MVDYYTPLCLTVQITMSNSGQVEQGWGAGSWDRGIDGVGNLAHSVDLL